MHVLKTNILFIVGLFLYNLGYAQSIFINEVQSVNNSTLTDSYTNTPDWIELFNQSNTPANLEGYFLTDTKDVPSKWKFPSTIIQSKGFVLIFASGLGAQLPNNELHCNFKLSSAGEKLYLFNKDTLLIDMLDIPALGADISYGRDMDGSNTYTIFDVPSPKVSNSLSSTSKVSEPPTFSHEPGFYSNDFYLKLSTQNSGATVYYTTDGSVPTRYSKIFKDSIHISQIKRPNSISLIRTTIPDNFPNFNYWKAPSEEAVFKINTIRAITIQNGYKNSKVITKSFFNDPAISTKYALPVLSLTSDSTGLFGADSGILIPGNLFNPNYQPISEAYFTANYKQSGKAWERNVNAQYFNAKGKYEFNIDAGLRVHGAHTRTLNTKSLRLYFRSEYGKNTLNHKIFWNSETDEFKRIILRNAGNDGTHAFIRDAFAQSLIDNEEQFTQKYQATNVFLNGEYWGILNIRERIDRHYFETKYNIPEDSIDFLESAEDSIEGDTKEWSKVKNFMWGHKLDSDENYNEFKDFFDIDHFIDYHAFQFYINNTDWPWNNVKFFRYKNPVDTFASFPKDGRWRYVIFDTDYSFGRINNYAYNLMDSVISGEGYASRFLRPLFGVPGNPDVPGNSEFRQQFINRFADLLNSSYKEEVVTRKFKNLKKDLDKDIDKHILRWCAPTSSVYKTEHDTIIKFANQRPKFLRTYLKEWFVNTIEGIDTVTIRISDKKAGYIQLNSLSLDSNLPRKGETIYPWNGVYFQGVPITVEAKPYAGYTFEKWADGDTNPSRTADIKDKKIFTAIFKPKDGLVTGLKINEILPSNINKYQSDIGTYPDCIEIFNNGSIPIDLAGLYLSDNPKKLTKWKIPTSNDGFTSVNAKDFIQFWADGDTMQTANHTNFKLDRNGAFVSIAQVLGNDTAIIDSLYTRKLPANVSFGRFPDGTDYTSLFPKTTIGAMNDSSTFRGIKQIKNLYVNELLASNSKDTVDEFSEREDWIELYNGNATEIDLAGMYLTDNPKNPFKHLITFGKGDSTLINGNAFKLYYADQDKKQSVNHLDFKLDIEGDFIGLVQAINGKPYFIDSIYFSHQSTDISYGRNPDGSDNWTQLRATSPEYSNYINNGINNLNSTGKYLIRSIYPNPANNEVNIYLTANQQNARINIYSISGTQMYSGLFSNYTNTIHINTSNYNAGVYVIRVQNNTQSESYKLIIQ